MRDLEEVRRELRGLKLLISGFIINSAGIKDDDLQAAAAEVEKSFDHIISDLTENG